MSVTQTAGSTGKIRVLVAKPGLDGHSNGAEQIALRARDVGFDVTYDGIRQTPAEIVAKAKETGAHVVGLSILSGSHVPLVREVRAKMREAGLDHIPVVVGGIIPPEDAEQLERAGVAAVYTPKDFEMSRIMSDLADLAEACKRMDIPYTLNPGEGAFYGPKIEFSLRDSIGRVWQCGTIQLDFSMPDRLGAEYVADDNARRIPVMLHRAILGSLERFIGVLTEHVGGAFPFWLAPVQARLVPIKDTHVEFCREFAAKLKLAGIRVDIDDRNESMGLKTREAQVAKIPFALAAGDREIQAGAFAVRKYGEKEQKVMTIDEIVGLFAGLNDPLK